MSDTARPAVDDRNAAFRSLSRIASDRHGIVSVAEAADLGLTRAQLRTALRRGDWRSAAPGVLVATGAPATWEQSCALAALATGGVVSHRAAARLHGLDGFENAVPELTVLRSRARKHSDAILHSTTTLEREDITDVQGLPATSVARTIVDLGAVVDDESVEQALDDALRRGFSALWIRRTLERLDRPGRNGTGALRRVLARPDRRGPLPDSVFERLVERSCTASGLPDPVRQHEVRDSDGRVIGRIDLAWPELLIGVEAHSRRWHFGEARSRADQRRANQLTALGWSMIYVGWTDVDDPEHFVGVLRTAHSTRRSAAVGRPVDPLRPA